ncbi:cation transporter [Cellulomonas sp. P4]|uniref:cation transporter n=1 Tax=Cellulomonas sp. P4 TaxID=3142533 RepID=UPI0031BAD26A
MDGPESPDPAAPRLRRERSALTVSAVAAAVLGTGAAVWGVVAGSGVILFDGIYTAAGTALVGVSALASRAAASEPGGRYPFGRHGATPLAVAMQGAALLATLVYGVADAVGTLLAGGSDSDPGSLVAYGALSAVVSAGVAFRLRRAAPDSELAHAEVVSWRAGAWLSLVVALGGVAAVVLDRTGRDTVVPYVDPALLLLAVALVGTLPLRLIRDGMHELLEGEPPADVAREVGRAVAAARERFGLPEPLVRATKLGGRLYLEVDFVVEPGRWDVDQEDGVRRAVLDGLVGVPLDVWATVELTTDPELAA